MNKPIRSLKIREPWRRSLGDKAALWRGGQHGFERESFRLDAATGLPSAVSHEQIFSRLQQSRQIDSFGGRGDESSRLRALLPRALTLDFSDQQLELVSPPHADIASAEADIALLLRFVAKELKRLKHPEILWAFAQPPLFGQQALAAVRLANFGAAADAEEKRQYRTQLLLRYGKAKQSWTGVHYNFSFDLRLFDDVSPGATYVHLARNLWRNFWLLELLFGCTPALPYFYIEQVQAHFARGKISLAAPPPHACSLHSHFGYGYRSSEQQLQYLDYSNPCAYWKSVDRSTKMESNFFRRLGLAKTKLIQDSRELYTPFRLKQLHAHGDECWDKKSCLVDYLELRILDIDPLFTAENYSGIYLPSIYLSHLLLLHSTLLESPPLSREELRHCAAREQYVASRGRKLPAEFGARALVLLEELGELCSLLGFSAPYVETVQNSLQALKDGRFRATEFVDKFAIETSKTMDEEPLLQHSRDWTQFLGAV